MPTLNLKTHPLKEPYINILERVNDTIIESQDKLKSGNLVIFNNDRRENGIYGAMDPTNNKIQCVRVQIPTHHTPLGRTIYLVGHGFDGKHKPVISIFKEPVFTTKMGEYGRQDLFENIFLAYDMKLPGIPNALHQMLNFLNKKTYISDPVDFGHYSIRESYYTLIQYLF